MQDYILKVLQELLAIDSPTGFTGNVATYAADAFSGMGFKPYLTKKGCVMVDLSDGPSPLMISAHIDTLGGMVHEIKAKGRLKLTALGGLLPNSIEGENCRIYTRFGKIYTGTAQLINASIHVNRSNPDTSRTFDTVEVLTDTDAKSKEEVEALGISSGDIVCFDPRTVITESGFIKSRFLDDKLSAAILIGLAKAVSEKRLILKRKVVLCLTVYEEVGHGCSAVVAPDTEEILCVDMGCVGEGMSCTERQVSICAKDSHGPYDYGMTTRLIQTAKDNGIDYAVDIYPYYGSDADAALSAGADIRHALIGAGVYASHGYERSHIDGMMNTFNLLKAFLS